MRFESSADHGEWHYDDIGEVHELVVKYHHSADVAKIKEHRFAYIGPNVFELRRRDGYEIPNKYHIHRALLIAMPEKWESEGSNRAANPATSS